MSIGKRIAHARKEAALSQQAVADRFSISRAAVAQWESGDTHPGMTKLEGLAQVLGVRLEWLATGKGLKRTGASAPTESTEGHRAAPLLPWQAIASWSERAEPAGGPERLMTRLEMSARAFALAIEDESMAPEFAPDDHVIIDPDILPQTGDFVVARSSHDEIAALRLYRVLERSGEEIVELVPLNAAWPTRLIDKQQPGRILGTMVEHRRYRHA